MTRAPDRARDLGDLAMAGRPLPDGDGELVVLPGAADGSDRGTGDGGRRSPDGHHEVAPDDCPYVVRFGSTWYTRGPDGWGPPHTGQDVRMQLARFWPGLRLSSDGERPAPLGPVPLLGRYGRLAREVVYAYGVDGYDYSTETLLVRVARASFPQPVRSELVDEYVDRAAGERADKLRDWLATAWRVTEPTAALVMSGPPRTGKSLVLAMVASPWGGPADASHVLSDFQDPLLRCPIIGADEGLPYSDRARSRKIRQYITTREVGVNPKGRPAGMLRGSPRMVVASNDADPLRLGTEALTPDDEGAIASRILHVPFDGGVVDWLAQHSKQVAADLPGHIAWLAANRVVHPGPRLLVEGDGADWLAAARTSTPLVQEICGVILDELDEVSSLAVSVDHDDGALLVQVGRLVQLDRWARRPRSNDVVAALVAFGAVKVEWPRPRRYRVERARIERAASR